MQQAAMLHSLSNGRSWKVGSEDLGGGGGGGGILTKKTKYVEIHKKKDKPLINFLKSFWEAQTQICNFSSIFTKHHIINAVTVFPWLTPLSAQTSEKN